MLLPLPQSPAGTAAVTSLLSDRGTRDILRLAGIRGRTRATRLRRQNGVCRIECESRVFFLETYTREWYAGGHACASGAYCVGHEVSAWACLATYRLAAPEVVAACLDCDNPAGRPYLLTRCLPGAPLPDLPPGADCPLFAQLLETTGAYLRRAHQLAFAHPGHIVGDGRHIVGEGPTRPPPEDAWQSAIWSAAQTGRNAVAVPPRGPSSSTGGPRPRAGKPGRYDVMRRSRPPSSPTLHAGESPREPRRPIRPRGFPARVPGSWPRRSPRQATAWPTCSTSPSRRRANSPSDAPVGPALRRLRRGTALRTVPAVPPRPERGELQAHGADRWPAAPPTTLRRVLTAATWDELSHP